MKLTQIYEEIYKNELMENSLYKIKQLITNHIDSSFNFTKKEKEFLQKTVKKDTNSYRGLSLNSPNFEQKDIDTINNLIIGNETPKFLLKSINDNDFTYYSKNIEVAQRYSDGKVSIIFKTKIPKENIICDLEYLPELVKKEFPNQTILNESDFVYMGKMRELIVIKAHNCDSKIISKIGNL